MDYKNRIPRLNGTGRLTTPSYDFPDVVWNEQIYYFELHLTVMRLLRPPPARIVIFSFNI
jgi:hypothetical protein